MPIPESRAMWDGFEFRVARARVGFPAGQHGGCTRNPPPMKRSLPRRPAHSSLEPLESRIAPAGVPTFELSTLDGASGFQLNGVAASDFSGISVSGAGDFNGDGFDDVLIGASRADQPVYDAGAAYLVFGKAGGFDPAFELSSLDGSNGFKIRGPNSVLGQFGFSASGAGDVNGDGFDDIIIGLPRNTQAGQGAAVVIFGSGSAMGAEFDLATLNGSNGFKVTGTAADGEFGRAVSGAGDVNGDGLDDVIIGAYRAQTGAGGAGYVVFGRASGFNASLSVSTLNGANGFAINGAMGSDNLGFAVSGAGDFNGDGIGDVIIGSPNMFSTGSPTGASYVIYGKTTGFSATVNAGALDGSNGFKLSGVAALDQTGSSVSSAGDLNGDGFDDIVIGAFRADPKGAGSGTSYVVFGGAGGFSADFQLASLDGSNGFRIDGAGAGDNAGRSVSRAGDINGDGLDDLLIGAYGNPGAAYLIFGSASGFGPQFDLAAFDKSDGLRIVRVNIGDGAGRSVSGAGDVNGDGFDDLIIGAPFADKPRAPDFGVSYGSAMSSLASLPGSLRPA